MLPIDESTPCFTAVAYYFHDYADVLLSFHNTMLNLPDGDDTSRYAKVLQFDGEFRAICAAKIPKFLDPQTPLEPQWPKWVNWAR